MQSRGCRRVYKTVFVACMVSLKAVAASWLRSSMFRDGIVSVTEDGDYYRIKSDWGRVEIVVDLSVKPTVFALAPGTQFESTRHHVGIGSTDQEWSGFFTDYLGFDWRIHGISPVYELTVPYWFVCGLFASLAMYCRKKSSPKNLDKSVCSKCSYDLTGNVSGVCPECGMTIGTEMERVREQGVR